MKWILGTGKDIVVDIKQLKARIEYIRDVTDADVSDWQAIQVNGQRFLYCVSNDNIEGVFITAHNDDVYLLSKLPQVYGCKIIIANTCILERLAAKKFLCQIRRMNSNSELYFAKQGLSLGLKYELWQTTTLDNVGGFGFHTSLSERELFMNRRKGLEEAIRQSFERVSTILLPGE